MFNQIPFDDEYVDIMNGCNRWEIKINEHGFVALVDVMPRLVPKDRKADYAVVQAARTSTGKGLKTQKEDTGLIRYLMRHRHSTPTEMCEFKFHMSLPIFVARQIVRHRMVSLNEYSARYSEVKDQFYIPDPSNVRQQSSSNKQGGDAIALDTDEYLNWLNTVCEDSFKQYKNALSVGVSRELARIGLPLNTYTEWYWKIDLHNLFHFLSLRMDKHAQKETRDYADAIFELIKPVVPDSCQAFLDYRYNAMSLTALEIEAIQNKTFEIQSDNIRETEEWNAKKTKLFGG